MKFAFISVEKAHFPVAFMCRELRVSRSGYYATHVRRPSKRAVENVLLTTRIREVFIKRRRACGSPRIYAELRPTIECSRKRVARIMRKEGLSARRHRSYSHTTNSHHAFPMAPNLLNRQFLTDAANKIWVADITYFPTHEGKFYLAAVMDLYSRRIVGWATSSSLEKGLCLEALRMALGSRDVAPGLVHHSDRGAQYASDEYRLILAKHGFESSMSRPDDCWDNAVAESFWASLKGENDGQTSFATRATARSYIVAYMEFYNWQRLHSTLGYTAPAVFEARRAA